MATGDSTVVKDTKAAERASKRLDDLTQEIARLRSELQAVKKESSNKDRELRLLRKSAPVVTLKQPAGRGHEFKIPGMQHPLSWPGKREVEDTAQDADDASAESDNADSDPGSMTTPQRSQQPGGTSHAHRTHPTPTPRIKTRGDMKYTGSIPFQTYLKKFELIADCNEWTAQEVYGNLIQNLSGAAEEEFTESGAGTFRSVCDILNKAFPREDSQTVLNKLSKRVQEKGESLTDFKRAIKRLVYKAHESADSTTRDQICRQYFIEGVKDKRIRRKLKESEILDFDRIVRRAINLEACQEAEDTSDKARVKTVAETTSDRSDAEGAWAPAFVQQITTELESIKKRLDKQPGKPKKGFKKGNNSKDIICFYCRQPGHMVRECPFKQAKVCPPLPQMAYPSYPMPYQGNGQGQVLSPGATPVLPHNLPQ